MRKYLLLLAIVLIPLLGMKATEAKQNRGLIAFIYGNYVQVEWRMRATDDPTQTQYLLYIDGKLYGTFRSKTTVRVSKSRYEHSVFSLVVKDKDGKEIDRQNDVKAWGSPCLDIPMTAPVIKGKGDTAIVKYEPSDASAYDMDDDGEQEIIIKWASAWVGKDAVVADRHQFVDCYKLNGKLLWRIDFGQNGIEGNNFNFEVSDFDGDGKGEMIVKTAPGCKDGLGNYVGKGLKGYPEDLEKVYKRGSDGGPVSGEEWVTCFDGTTGKELATRQYWPYFGIQANWDTRPNQEDGQNYGRRGNGFKSAVIRIPCRDGQVRPCCYLQRGIYTYVYATAISWNGKDLAEEWRHGSTAVNSSFTENATGKYTQNISLMSQGAHQGQAGDLDGDGYDEVMIGAAAIDHDGTVLWSTGLGHGDAEGVGEFNLDNPGLEAWRITEVNTKYDACMMDGKTGDIMNGQLYTKGDVGRGVIMDLDSTSAGSEYWFMTDGGKMYDQNGKVLYSYTRGNGTGYPSFRIFWDGDLLDEHFDGDMVSKFDLASHSWVRSTFYRKTDGKNVFYKRYHVFSINSSKKNACLQCDLLGDFREELVMPARANDLNRTDCDYVLRVITTTFDTDKKLPWLRDDYLYNLQIANQNVGYSMPPHLSYNAYAWYQSLGQMGKDEIVETTTGTQYFSPTKGAYYYLYVDKSEGTALNCSELSGGQISVGDPQEIEFVQVTDSTYYMKSVDGKYLKASGNYGFATLDDASTATPFIGYMDGTYVFFKSTDDPKGNGNIWLTRDQKRNRINRGATESKASRFTAEATGDNAPSSVKTVNADINTTETWYDLGGCKVSKSHQRGVYIRKGKKIVKL